MKSRLLFLILLLIPLATGCSKQWRENNVSISAQDMMAELEQVSTLGVGGGYEDFKNLAGDPGTTIYYADSAYMGPPATVASIGDFSFMVDSFSLAEVSRIKVFFLDYKDGDYHENAMMIVAQLTDGFESVDIFWGEGSVQDGQFVVDLVSDDGAAGITVKSFDVSKGGELNGTIQLKTYLYPDTYVGKFSTLIGYK